MFTYSLGRINRGRPSPGEAEHVSQEEQAGQGPRILDVALACENGGYAHHSRNRSVHQVDDDGREPGTTLDELQGGEIDHTGHEIRDTDEKGALLQPIEAPEEKDPRRESQG